MRGQRMLCSSTLELASSPCAGAAALARRNGAFQNVWYIVHLHCDRASHVEELGVADAACGTGHVACDAGYSGGLLEYDGDAYSILYILDGPEWSVKRQRIPDCDMDAVNDPTLTEHLHPTLNSNYHTNFCNFAVDLRRQMWYFQSMPDWGSRDHLLWRCPATFRDSHVLTKSVSMSVPAVYGRDPPAELGEDPLQIFTAPATGSTNTAPHSVQLIPASRSVALDHQLHPALPDHSRSVPATWVGVATKGGKGGVTALTPSQGAAIPGSPAWDPARWSASESEAVRLPDIEDPEENFWRIDRLTVDHGTLHATDDDEHGSDSNNWDNCMANELGHDEFGRDIFGDAPGVTSLERTNKYGFTMYSSKYNRIYYGGPRMEKGEFVTVWRDPDYLWMGESLQTSMDRVHTMLDGTIFKLQGVEGAGSSFTASSIVCLDANLHPIPRTEHPLSEELHMDSYRVFVGRSKKLALVQQASPQDPKHWYIVHFAGCHGTHVVEDLGEEVGDCAMSECQNGLTQGYLEEHPDGGYFIVQMLATSWRGSVLRQGPLPSCEGTGDWVLNDFDSFQILDISTGASCDFALDLERDRWYFMVEKGWDLEMPLASCPARVRTHTWTRSVQNTYSVPAPIDYGTAPWTKELQETVPATSHQYLVPATKYVYDGEQEAVVAAPWLATPAQWDTYTKGTYSPDTGARPHWDECEQDLAGQYYSLAGVHMLKQTSCELTAIDPSQFWSPAWGWIESDTIQMFGQTGHVRKSGLGHVVITWSRGGHTWEKIDGEFHSSLGYGTTTTSTTTVFTEVVGLENSNECPFGSSTVTSAAVCEEVAHEHRELHGSDIDCAYTYWETSDFVIANGAEYPRGCFISMCAIYFNPHDTGAPRAETYPYCKADSADAPAAPEEHPCRDDPDGLLAAVRAEDLLRPWSKGEHQWFCTSGGITRSTGSGGTFEDISGSSGFLACEQVDFECAILGKEDILCNRKVRDLCPFTCGSCVREEEASPYAAQYEVQHDVLLTNDILWQGEVDNLIQCQSKCVMTTDPVDSRYVANCRAISYRLPGHHDHAWCALHSKIGELHSEVGNWRDHDGSQLLADHHPAHSNELHQWAVYARTDVADPPSPAAPPPEPEPAVTSYSEIPRATPEIRGGTHRPNRLDPESTCGKNSFGIHGEQFCIENFHFYGMFPGTCSIGYLETHKDVDSVEDCAAACFDSSVDTQHWQTHEITGSECGFFSYSSQEKRCALYKNWGCGAGYQDHKLFFFSYAIARWEDRRPPPKPLRWNGVLV